MKARHIIWVVVVVGVGLLLESYRSAAAADFLQKFQTLIAALIAAVAALLAYEGAMAKVEFDRVAARQALTATKLGLMIRLDYSLNAVKLQLESTIDTLKNRKVSKISESTKKALQVAIDEAWANLHLFPADIAIRVGALKLHEGSFTVFESHESIGDDVGPEVIDQLRDLIQWTVNLLQELSGTLDKAIDELKDKEPEF